MFVLSYGLDKKIQKLFQRGKLFGIVIKPGLVDQPRNLPSRLFS
jgi:hypothetical protein